MAIIDADAHVVECEETWDFFEESDKADIPVLFTSPNGGRHTKFWAIDGRLLSVGPVNESDATKAVRKLSDVAGRVRQMDELGTDIQMLYPTLFLRPLTKNPRIERALCHSYNQWMADRVSRASGRLAWAVVPPTMIIEQAIAEIRFGFEHGAKTVFWRGYENNRLPNDPYFAPTFDEVNRLGLSVCVHSANGSFDLHDIFPGESFWVNKIPGITALQVILNSNMAALYPNVRFGIIEFSASWVPYVLHDVVKRAARGGRELDPKNILAENRVYVACQSDDDLEYAASYIGPNNLVSGTDFGHADTSSELNALTNLQRDTTVAPEIISRILDENPRALYDLT